MSIPRFAVRAVLIVASAVLFLSAGLAPDRFAPASRGIPPTAEYVPGQLLVKFKKEAGTSQRAELRQNLGATTLRRFRQPIEQLELGPGLTTEQALELCRNDPRIEYAEPNYIVHADVLPNDLRFDEMYGLRNTGQTGGTPGADISAELAWDVTTGSRDVIVAVIDTGIDYNHPDLAANIWTNPGEIPDNEIDDDGNGFIDDVHGWDFHNNDNDPFDDNFHGTHVAGTIGAIGDNGIGVAGINWKVSLVPLKFLGSSGSGSTADAVLAVEYATLIGANITNNSWGGGSFSMALRDAIEAAEQEDILFVAAAGNLARNNDQAPHYPSSYELPGIIAVAATDHNDRLAGFSSYGATSVDLAAPGVSILSTYARNRINFLNGTSMAAPHVAGTAALVRAVRPDIGVVELKQLILDHVDPVPGLAGVTLTGGRLNAYAPLASTDETPPGRIDDLTADDTEGSFVRLTWTATGDDGDEGIAARYDLRYSSAPIEASSFASATPVSTTPAPQPAGSTEAMEIVGLEFATPYYFAVRARDDWGNTGPLSNIASATTPQPPILLVSSDSIEAGLFMGQSQLETLSMENAGVGALDWQILEEPDDAPYSWLSVTPSGGRLLSGESSDVSVVINAGELGPGTYEASLRLVSNDPLQQPFRTLAVTLQVSPAPVARIDPARLDWGRVFINTSAELGLEVRNAGTELLEVSGIVSSEPQVVVADSAFTLAAGQARMMVATFSPTASGTLEGGLTLTSNAPNAPSVEIPITGSSAPPPQLQFLPAGFDETLFTGELRSRSLLVTNPGESDLSVTFLFAETTDRHSVLPVLTNGGFESGSFAGWIAKWNGVQQRIGWTAARAGSGFFGNSQPYEGEFSILNGFDGAAGLEYTLSKEISVPEFLTRAELEFHDRIQYDGLGVPSSLPRIYEATIQDLDGNVLTQILREELVLNGSPYTDLGWQRRSVDLLPFSGQRIRLQIRQFVPESFTGPASIEFDAFRIDAEGFPSWLSVIPPTAAIPPGQTLDVELRFDAKNLTAGIRAGEIEIENNVPDAPPERIPVGLEVVGAPDIVLPGDEIVLESVQPYDTGGARTFHSLILDKPPIGAGTVHLAADGDFGFSGEEATAVAEGLELGSVGIILADCFPATADFPIGAVDLAALAFDGIVEIEVLNSPGVTTKCDVNEHRVRLSYQVALERVNFGMQLVEADGYVDFVVANVGTEMLNISSIETDSTVFSASPGTMSIPPGGSQAVSVIFSPEEEGTAEAILTLTSNDPDSPNLQVPLIGAAVDQPLVIATPEPLEATVLSGDNTERTLVLSNSADFDLRFSILPPTTEVFPLFDFYSGTIPAEDSLEIGALFRAGGLAAGVYESTTVITSDDPTRSRIFVPTRLTVTGAPQVTVTESMEFGELFVGATREMNLVIANTGSDPLQIFSVTGDLPEFTPSASFLEVQPGQAGSIGVAFAPSTFGGFSGTLTLTTNDPTDASVTVAMTGFGEEPPELESFPDAIVDTVAAGEPKLSTLTISNAGLSPLEFSLEVPVEAGFLAVLPTSGSVPPLASMDVDVLLNAAELLDGSYTSLIEISSNDPMTPMRVVPVELTVVGVPQMVAVGEPIAGESSRSFTERGDETSHQFMAPVPSFGSGTIEVVFVGDFGNAFEGATVFAEGEVVGGIQETGTDCIPVTREFEVDGDRLADWTADGLVTVEVQNSGIVDPFCAINSHTVRLRYTGTLDDLEFGEVLVGATRTLEFTVENPGTATLDVFSIVTDLPGVTASPESLVLPPGQAAPVELTFAPAEAIAFEGVLTLAGNAPDAPTITRPVRGIGLEPPDLEIDPPEIQTSLLAGTTQTRTVTISNLGTGTLELSVGPGESFVSVVNPGTSTVPPGGSIPLSIEIDSRGLLPGTHSATIDLSTNDPADGSVGVPVELQVVGGPNLETSPSVAFDRTFIGSASIQTLSVSNSGSETLNVSSIAGSGLGFSASPSSLTVAPAASATIDVTFAPSSEGVFEGTLLLSSDDPDEPERIVTLGGVAANAPDAELGSAELAVDVPQGGVALGSISLANIGEGVLQYSVEVDAAAKEFLAVGTPTGSVAASGATEIDITFDGRDLNPGLHEGVIRILTDDPEDPLFEMTASLSVIPAPNIQIDFIETIDFGPIFVGQVGQAELILRNEGAETLVIGSIAVDSAEFGVDPGNLTVPPGSVTAVSLAFSPTDTAPANATLAIGSNDPDTPFLSIALIGVGKTPPALEIVAESLELTLDELQETTRAISVRNVGAGRLELSAVVNPPQPGFLTVVPDASTLEPGEELDVVVGFVAASPGLYEATVDLLSNDPLNPLVRLPLALNVTSRPILSLNTTQTVESVRDYSGNSGASTSHTLELPAVPCCGGTIELIADGDFGSPQEFATATAEGTLLGTAGDQGMSCRPNPSVFPLDAAALASLAGDNVIEVEVENSFSVNTICATNRHTVRLTYPARIEALEFGEVFSGTSRTLTLTVSNDGSDDLVVGSIVADSAEFIPSLPAVSIGPRASADLAVEFRPTSAGDFEATLRLMTNDPLVPQAELILTGSSVEAPALRTAPDILSVSVTENGQMSRTLTVTNVGGSPLTVSVEPRHPGTASEDGSGVFRPLRSSGLPMSCVVADPSSRSIYAQTEQGFAFFRYDVEADEWNRLTDAPINANNNCGATLLDGRIYTAYPAEDLLLGVYEIATDTWSTIEHPLGLKTGVIADDGDSSLYLARGRTAVRFDPVTLEIETLPPASIEFDPRGGLRFFEGRLYGNQGRNGNAFVAFDVETGEWLALPPTPTETVLAAEIDPLTREYVTMGPHGGNNIYRFSFEDGTWSVSAFPFFPLNDGGLGWLGGSVPALYLVRGQQGTDLMKMLSGRALPGGNVDVPPDPVVVPEGGSVDFEVSFNAAGLLPGLYQSALAVESDAPDRPVVLVPTSLQVLGVSDIEISSSVVTQESSVDFLGGGAVTEHAFQIPVPPADGATLEITVRGDYGSANETATIVAEGQLEATIESVGQDCESETRTYSIDAETFAGWVADDLVELSITNSDEVGFFCALNRHEAKLSFRTPSGPVQLGTLFVGQSKTVPIRIDNRGNGRLEIVRISTASADVTVSSTALQVPPRGSAEILVTFAPTVVGPLDEILTIESNDPDEPFIGVPLAAEALPSSRAVAQPAALHATLPPDSDRVRTRTIRLANPGAGELIWGATAFQAPSPASSSIAEWQERAKGDEADNGAGGVSSLHAGGPDAFGYRFRDSDQPDGPSFSWIDVPTIGTPLPLSQDDQNSGPVEIGFDFPFYGNTFDTVNVCTNGWLSFTSDRTGFSNPDRLPSRGFSVPGNLLAPFWDDLTPGTIEYHGNSERFVVQYTGTDRLSSEADLTFQVVLYPSGRIVFRYLTMSGTLDSATIGIQNADKTIGLLAAYNRDYVRDRFAVEFAPAAPWLALEPVSGEIPSQGFADLSVTFSAAGLDPGVHAGRILLHSNDPDESTLSVPVELRASAVEVDRFDVEPGALDPRSAARFARVRVQLPPEYDPRDIAVQTVALDDLLFAAPSLVTFEDADGDGIEEIVLKFDRRRLLERIASQPGVPLSISGEVEDRTWFRGITSIVMIDPERLDP